MKRFRESFPLFWIDMDILTCKKSFIPNNGLNTFQELQDHLRDGSVCNKFWSVHIAIWTGLWEAIHAGSSPPGWSVRAILGTVSDECSPESIWNIIYVIVEVPTSNFEAIMRDDTINNTRRDLGDTTEAKSSSKKRYVWFNGEDTFGVIACNFMCPQIRLSGSGVGLSMDIRYMQTYQWMRSSWGIVYLATRLANKTVSIQPTSTPWRWPKRGIYYETNPIWQLQIRLTLGCQGPIPTNNVQGITGLDTMLYKFSINLFGGLRVILLLQIRCWASLQEQIPVVGQRK